MNRIPFAYLCRRAGWYGLTFFLAVGLNFTLPRLGPANPIDTLMTKLSSPGMDSKEYLAHYRRYQREFNLDRSLPVQFLTYAYKVVRGDLGASFTRYPRPVSEILLTALPWSLALQLPAILLAWIVGNLLGAVAAYRRGAVDGGLYPAALFLSAVPYYCLALLLVYYFSIRLPVFPPFGAYAQNLMPGWSASFVQSVLDHYWLPFLSLFLVLVGGQAIGMRSMAIYEMGAHYVHYCKSLGLGEWRITATIFRNAMLPQITGLALSLGVVVGGALLTEIVFSYPGVGMVLFTAIRENDYPVIGGCTLLITTGVLVANFFVDIALAVFDPRVRLGAR